MRAHRSEQVSLFLFVGSVGSVGRRKTLFPRAQQTKRYDFARPRCAICRGRAISRYPWFQILSVSSLLFVAPAGTGHSPGKGMVDTHCTGGLSPRILRGAGNGRRPSSSFIRGSRGPAGPVRRSQPPLSFPMRAPDRATRDRWCALGTRERGTHAVTFAALRAHRSPCPRLTARSPDRSSRTPSSRSPTWGSR